MTRYSLVVVEKGHGSEDTAGGGGLLKGDSTIPALGKQLKQRKPEMFVLFYQNPLLDFLLSDVHVLAMAAEAAGETDIFAKNTDGSYSMNFVNKTNPVGGACSKEAQNYPAGVRLYNMSVPAMRSILIDQCAKHTRTGSIDGCHIDRANWAEINYAHGSGQNGNSSHQGTVQKWTATQGRQMAEGEKLLLGGLQSAVGAEMLISSKENPTVREQLPSTFAAFPGVATACPVPLNGAPFSTGRADDRLDVHEHAVHRGLLDAGL